MDGGRSLEYLNGTIKKAPSIKDEDAWQLRYLYIKRTTGICI